jgi:hypothetical protein
MSTGNIKEIMFLGSKVRPVREASVSRFSRQSWILNIWQPYRPPRPVTGTALLFTLLLQQPLLSYAFANKLVFTATVGNNSRGIVFSILFVPRCYRQNCWLVNSILRRQSECWLVCRLVGGSVKSCCSWDSGTVRVHGGRGTPAVGTRCQKTGEITADWEDKRVL